MSTDDTNAAPAENWATKMRRETKAQIAEEKQAEIKSQPHNLRFPPGPHLEDRLKQICAASNPLLEAAGPLLLALAQMPQVAQSVDGSGVAERAANIEAFRELLKREVVDFQMLCNRAHIEHRDMLTASYCICTALDEAANSTAWGGSTGSGDVGVWAKDMLAQRFHGDSDGGKKIFLLIGRLATTEPKTHRDLLEVIYQILSLGFQGQYRVGENGHRTLEMIRKHVHGVTMTMRPPVSRVLSPNIQVEREDRFQALRNIPVWLSATVMALVVLGTFGYYKYQLSLLRDQTVDNIVAIGNMTAPAVASSPIK